MSDHSTRRQFLRNAGFIAAAGAGTRLTLAPAHGAPLGSVARAAKHVLLISVDGLHAIDLVRWVEAQPASVLAQLSGRGYTFSRARTPEPSDSFPGLIARPSPRESGTTWRLTGTCFRRAAWGRREP
jgi:hypothetical protein